MLTIFEDLEENDSELRKIMKINQVLSFFLNNCGFKNLNIRKISQNHAGKSQAVVIHVRKIKIMKARLF